MSTAEQLDHQGFDHSSPEPSAASRKPRRSFPMGPFLALVLSGSLATWMSLGPAPAVIETPASSAPSTVALQSVRTVQSVAQETTRLITAEGDTSAIRRGTISSRISGIVSDLPAPKGTPVARGQAIVRLHVPDFSATRAEAFAQMEEAQRNYDNLKTLAGRGLATEDRLVGAKTALAGAEARWLTITQQEEDMTIKAPFSGEINTLDAEIGDNLSPGNAIAEILDLSSLTVRASIPQSQVSSLERGQSVSVSLVTGEEVEGHITYISSQADRQTRSFPIEVEIANPDGRLRAGVSASIEMEGEKRMTHAVPAAYLSLGPEGELIVKTIEDGTVVAHAVEVVSSGLEELLVAGLPDEVEIITVGQGFVRPGDSVRTERVQ